MQGRALVLALAALALGALSLAAPARAESRDLAVPDVAFADKWSGLESGCSYLAPKDPFVASDGGFDVVFHFHAGQMSEKEMRASGLRGVFVSCGFGLGTTPYADRFADPGHFGRMIDALARGVGKAAGKDAHVRRIALASWSAGFAAVAKILAVDRYYDAVDAVVLLDSLHASYKNADGKPAHGVDDVDTRGLAGFIRFAKDATRGKKTMVMTHSAIIPPDYASSTEATQALLTAIGAPMVETSEAFASGMTLDYRVDQGGLHVRGFRGRGPKDHFAHLYLIGQVLRSWVVPRWKREDPLVYTLAGEQR